ncbi:MAG TPA: 5'-3' exonuclease [Candidatus Binatia bacterium]|jgi:5'-3' exonuclease|nr:5'-3' exonuclease [Candidatus Binatia bacterium]
MLLLIDYSSLLYRAFHSVPDSVATHAVYGFLNMLARLVTDRRPTAIGIAVDDDWRPAFRTDVLPTYKAQRVAEEGDEDLVGPQEAIGRDVLRAMGVAVVGAAGYEAEDVIATLAARTTGRVEIVSGDRDLFALVCDPDVSVLYPVSGVSTLTEVNEAEITRRYGIPGRGYADYAILRGDPSDNLPGVPGIGEKTASKLIAQYGSLERLLAATDVVPAVARKLDAAREYLAAARSVVPPVATVPLAEVDMTIPTMAAHPRTLATLAKEHQLETPIGRLQKALAAD